MDSMLDVQQVTKAYRTRAERRPALAVDHVSFGVEAGEFFTLLGPSGCGKSTTLRCVAGLETPDSGEISLAGDVVFSSARRHVVRTNHRDIGMVFQSYAIWPHMSVFDNVAFPLEAGRVPRRDRRARVERALEMVGLAELASRSATQLSGGQQQRVALARAVVRDAKLLLLDEPLSNLDARLRVQMRSELRELQQRLGTTTVYVTHDQDEALSLSDRVAVLRGGRVVEIGRPRDLYLHPRHVFTAEFVGQADLLPCRVESEAGGSAQVRTDIGTFTSAQFPAGLRGDAALLMRPEHFEVFDAEPSGGNVVSGRVVDVQFTGKLTELDADVAGRRLRVHTLSTTTARQGDHVWLRIPPERCVVLGEDAAAGATAEELVEDTRGRAPASPPATPVA